MKKKGSKKVADYRCKHCGNWCADHRPTSLHCPTERQGELVYFAVDKTYEADMTKPKAVPFSACR